MARPSNSDDDSIRINFRLNPRRPKERVILEFLKRHAENYDASRVIKQTLYEAATGRSWLTDQSITRTTTNDFIPTESSNTNADQMIDDIISGIDDWLGQ